MTRQKSTLRTKNTREKILDAALRSFNEHGIEATTIEMIREDSGASVGSVYHHFGNKENIGATLYLEAMRDYQQGLQGLLAAAENAEAGVKAITRSYIDWVGANPEQARFILYSRRYLARSGLMAEAERETQRFLAAIANWFKPLIASGKIKRLPKECYSSLLLGSAHDYARLWLSGRSKKPIGKFRDIFAEAAWSALKPD